MGEIHDSMQDIIDIHSQHDENGSASSRSQSENGKVNVQENAAHLFIEMPNKIHEQLGEEEIGLALRVGYALLSMDTGAYETPCQPSFSTCRRCLL
jgi:hypothetical protein